MFQLKLSTLGPPRQWLMGTSLYIREGQRKGKPGIVVDILIIMGCIRPEISIRPVDGRLGPI